jgi:hypothetical protein
MFFASPIWLALLLPPWAGVAAWLMWSKRGDRTDVPFLALWRGGAEDSPREKREFRPPPIAVVAAMAAALLAIVAAGRPGIGWASPTDGPHITIILDRGVTMSVGDRRAEVVDAAAGALHAAFGSGPTDFVAVPDGRVEKTDRSDWLGPARSLPPTQEQTADAIQVAAKRALATTSGPVIVLSDQAAPDDPRVVQIAPAKAIQNVAIAKFAVRETPQPQAMVTVANYSPQERATLRVESGERNAVERAIDLPGTAGGEAKFFVDLPALDASAVAEIEVTDDIAVDNIAHAKRQKNFPTIEIRSPAAAEVRRVVEAYSKARPAGEGSKVIAIVAEDAIPGDVPVAIVASESSAGEAGPVTVAAHPVSAGVDWTDARPQAAGAPPVEGGQAWRAVVSVGGRPAVAVRESPQRQVWIGFDAPDFARTPEFVIFWTNVFDWLAGGGGETGEAGDAGRHWASTVVPPVRITPPSSTDWRSKLATLKPAHRRRTDVTSAVVLLSVICLILAAVAWPRRSLTPISAARTVVN